MSTRFLHVANGTSTTRLIEAAGIPGERSVWTDPLHDGPVPAGLTDDELVEVSGAIWPEQAPAGAERAAHGGGRPRRPHVNSGRPRATRARRQRGVGNLFE